MLYAWWQSSVLNYVASEHNYVDINKSNDNITMLHVDMIYFARRGQKPDYIDFSAVTQAEILQHCP